MLKRKCHLTAHAALWRSQTDSCMSAETINKSKGQSCSKQNQTCDWLSAHDRSYVKDELADWKFHCVRESRLDKRDALLSFETWLISKTCACLSLLFLLDLNNPRLMFRFGGLILSVRSSGSVLRPCGRLRAHALIAVLRGHNRPTRHRGHSGSWRSKRCSLVERIAVWRMCYYMCSGSWLRRMVWC